MTHEKRQKRQSEITLSKDDASAFAEKHIPGTDMWARLSQVLLLGALLKLQHDKPRAWGAGDISDLLCLDKTALTGALRAYIPPSIGALDDTTFEGVRITWAAFMSPVLAEMERIDERAVLSEDSEESAPNAGGASRRRI